MLDNRDRQRIAIIGSGISGLTAAYLLSQKHDVVLFERNSYLGGHTHTREVESGGAVYKVNTGFIVFNDWTYPNFIKLMDRLDVKSEHSDMSFSVRCENTGLEYNGTSLNSLFSQRMNLVNPKFIRMVLDILRFNKDTVDGLDRSTIDENESLGDYLTKNQYTKYFIDFYILPMGAAIWSASIESMKAFPLKFFLRFFNNHGMLSVDHRPQWKVISGGSSSYVGPLTKTFWNNIYCNSEITKVIRRGDSVVVVDNGNNALTFDQVVMACHSDQALAMLDSPTQEEKRILGAIPYQKNEVTLHTDESMMPKKKLTWAAWNYHIPQRVTDCAMVTYNMNILQNFDKAPETFLVTLNRSNEINEEKIIEQYQYSHPLFTQEGIKAQSDFEKINNKNRTHYCGAYWFNGFHEDGVNSALRVAKTFGLSLEE